MSGTHRMASNRAWLPADACSGPAVGRYLSGAAAIAWNIAVSQMTTAW